MTEIFLGPGWRKAGKDEKVPGGQEQIHHFWPARAIDSFLQSEIWVYDKPLPPTPSYDRKEEVEALGVPCPQCGVEPNVVCRWPDDLQHMVPNAHWARRSMAEYGELGIE